MAYPDPLATDKADATATPTDHPTHHNDLATYVNTLVGRTSYLTVIGANLTWTNMPAAATELDSNTAYRTLADLRGFTTSRLIVSRGGNNSGASAVLRAQYSINSGSSWADLTEDLNINYNSGVAASATMTIPAEALIQSALIRIEGQDGTGAADPNFTNIQVELS